MPQPRTPIALFAYDRPEHVGRAIESLRRCDRIDECSLHIYCDGPRDPSRTVPVARTRTVVHERTAGLDVQVIQRPTNLGLARSVVTAVTELCRSYGRVIVVEDDFEVYPDFVDFMLQALDRYEDAPCVYQVSGYMFPIEHPRSPDAFFLPLTTTRGWATWERAWRLFDPNPTGVMEELSDPETRRRFDLEDRYPFARMLEDRLCGRNDSWGILWWWVVFLANGLALHPRRSLVRVGGFDGSGTHCGKLDGGGLESRDAAADRRLGRPIVFPSAIEPDPAAMERIAEFVGMQQKAHQAV